ncbi:MAG: hypothetical protein M3511_15990, partial [Deinococcota bacterium]|nr:hypothetical protein [Deinococcota bacterium]
MEERGVTPYQLAKEGGRPGQLERDLAGQAQHQRRRLGLQGIDRAASRRVKRRFGNRRVDEDVGVYKDGDSLSPLIAIDVLASEGELLRPRSNNGGTMGNVSGGASAVRGAASGAPTVMMPWTWLGMTTKASVDTCGNRDGNCCHTAPT